MRRKSTKTTKKRVARKHKTGVYNGITWESHEELNFLYWAEEMQKEGFIREITRAESYSLSDAVTINYIKQLKSSGKPMSQVVMKGHVYTPEFDIAWTSLACPFLWDRRSGAKREKHHIFEAYYHNGYHSIVEIKPMHDFKNMERLVKLNIKWLLQREGVWVNLIKNEMLFPATFTPLKYHKTSTGKPRAIKWEDRTVKQYINSL